ncbi:MAG TPA: DUF2490 domain-containing protein [Chitinophagaceae bacterium]|nr:DUF2490 domain-containing protein [Chitinophagaceae bacterium]
MITKKHIAFIILFLPIATKAQHTTVHSNVLWAGYGNAIRFNNKWSLLNDVQVRTNHWADKWLLYAIRTGLSYSINDNAAVTAGFTLFKSAQYEGSDLFFKNEWRPWEEVSYKIKIKKINLLQRLRTEQRFLQQVINNRKANIYKYIFRLRYRFEWQFPLTQNTIKLIAGNEILVNPGYLNSSLFFDQNRTFAGINFKLSTTTSLQCQYTKIFQWRSTTSVLEDQDVLRVNVYQQFNTRKFHKSHKPA